jgi:outer membrane protein TolC
MLQHPDLAKALAKLRQEEANRSFYGQDLLPEIEIEAAALRTGDGGLGAGWPDVSENYKLGAFGTTPLLLMKGRGRLDASKAKAESAELEAALVRRDVRLTVLVSVNDVQALERILAVQAEAVRQARFLRDGEQRRFDNSESTLFLVNQRDRLLLDEQVKLVAYEAKYVKARGALALALGEPAALREPRSVP